MPDDNDPVNYNAPMANAATILSMPAITPIIAAGKILTGGFLGCLLLFNIVLVSVFIAFHIFL